MNSVNRVSSDHLQQRSFRACVAAILLIALLAFFMASCAKEEEKAAVEVVRPVKMMTTASGGEAFKRAFPGKVQASQEVDLSFKVSGPLIKLPVKEGQEVKKGQLLARIDPRDFKTNLDQAKARSLEAQQQFKRYQDLYIQKQVSKADFDKYKSSRDVARAQQEEVQHALEDTFLRAPFAGVIAKKFVDNFQDVQAKQAIVSLQDVSSIEIHINVPEALMAMARDKKGATAMAEFSTAPGKQYKLSIKEFSTRADPQTQTFQVTLLMKQPEDVNILPGMTANVVVTGASTEGLGDQIVIPAIAVFADESGTSHVWVVDPKTSETHRRKVTTGSLTGKESIRITDGLKPGEMIAVAGVTQLREGMKVRAMDK
jgi:RND family efflux transporter MFP subunit